MTGPAQSILTLITVLCSALSVGCSLYVVTRDARWRKSGLAAQLTADVAAAKRWFDTPEAKALQADIATHAGRIAASEQRLENTATKTDVAHLQGALQRVEAVVVDAAQGVDRIESLLIKKAFEK